MKTTKMSTILVLALGLMVCSVKVSEAAPMGTAFTYQGRLIDANTTADGEYDFSFRLYDANTAGSQVGSDVNKPDVDLIDGYFTVELDFGSGIFDGDARWLEIGVRSYDPCDVNAFTTLSPRQEVTPTPYALALPGLWTQQNPTSANLIGGYTGNTVTDDVVGATIGGGGNSTYPNMVTDDYGTVGGGKRNHAGDDAGTTADAQHATVGGGYSNTASAEWATIGGGRQNVTSQAYATVAGGYGNNATGTQSSVGGGQSNTASNQAATVSGGINNTGSGYYATVAGGQNNTASDWLATVGGGFFNTASNFYATVGGGRDNMASNLGGTVPGGRNNVAGGEYSFAAGHRAKVRDATASGDSDGDEGTFVWADSTDADFQSTGPDQFLIRASGGVGIGTTSPTEALEVNGTAKATAFVGDGSGLTGIATGDSDWTISGNDMYSAVSGNVGIGTASPANKLDVQGGNITVNGFRVLGFVGSAEATGNNTGNNTWQDVPGVSLNYNLNTSMVVTFRAFGTVNINGSIAMLRFVIDGVPPAVNGDRYAYCQYMAELPWYMERDVSQNAGNHSVKVQFRGNNASSRLFSDENARTRLKVEAR